MIDLTHRSTEKELLDLPDIPFDDIRLNMQELNIVNRYLGGHRISITGLKKILANYKTDQPLTICEIGCGGGDNLKAIWHWCSANSIKASFIGIDIKAECIHFAKSQYPGLPVDWLISDYELVHFPEKPAIIFSSLFCHHFSNDELIRMLTWMKTNSTAGFFINDLHRNFLAYYSIKLLTSIFSNSYLVKNDGPISVTRGFKKEEWQSLLLRCG